MAERIIYDKIWLDGYLNQLKQYENYVKLIKENLCYAKTSILSEQMEIYLSIMREFDKIEHNFQVMHRITEKFMNEAQICAAELEKFGEMQLGFFYR